MNTFRSLDASSLIVQPVNVRDVRCNLAGVALPSSLAVMVIETAEEEAPLADDLQFVNVISVRER